MQQKAQQTTDLLKSDFTKEAMNKTIQATQNAQTIAKSRNTLEPFNINAASRKLYDDVVKAPIAKTQNWMKQKEQLFKAPQSNVGSIPLGPSTNTTVREGIEATTDSGMQIVGGKDGAEKTKDTDNGNRFNIEDVLENKQINSPEPDKLYKKDGGISSKVWDYSKQFDGELSNFNTGYEIKTMTDKDVYLVQFHSDAEVGKGRSLKYWTTFDEANVISTIDDYMVKMALLSNWGARDNVSIAKIPAGTKVKYAIGTAREQISPIESRPGGGLQLLFEQFDDNWVITTKSLKMKGDAKYE